MPHPIILLHWYSDRGQSYRTWRQKLEAKAKVNEIEVDLTDLVGNSEIKFFFPFTTTLIEIKLNREPVREVAYFL